MHPPSSSFILLSIAILSLNVAASSKRFDNNQKNFVAFSSSEVVPESEEAGSQIVPASIHPFQTVQISPKDTTKEDLAKIEYKGTAGKNEKQAKAAWKKLKHDFSRDDKACQATLMTMKRSSEMVEKQVQAALLNATREAAAAQKINNQTVHLIAVNRAQRLTIEYLKGQVARLTGVETEALDTMLGKKGQSQSNTSSLVKDAKELTAQKKQREVEIQKLKYDEGDALKKMKKEKQSWKKDEQEQAWEKAQALSKDASLVKATKEKTEKIKASEKKIQTVEYEEGQALKTMQQKKQSWKKGNQELASKKGQSQSKAAMLVKDAKELKAKNKKLQGTAHKLLAKKHQLSKKLKKCEGAAASAQEQIEEKKQKQQIKKLKVQWLQKTKEDALEKHIPLDMSRILHKQMPKLQQKLRHVTNATTSDGDEKNRPTGSLNAFMVFSEPEETVDSDKSSSDDSDNSNSDD